VAGDLKVGVEIEAIRPIQNAEGLAQRAGQVELAGDGLLRIMMHVTMEW